MKGKKSAGGRTYQNDGRAYPNNGRPYQSDGRSYPMVAGGNPNVIKEAEERKRGGKVKSGKHVGKIHGAHPAHRMDRPGRKAGGRVGADRSPLSSAHGTTGAETSPKTQEGGMSK